MDNKTTPADGKPHLSIRIEVYCSCGAELCRQSKADGNRIIVEPCQNCLSRSKDERGEKG